MLKAQATCTTAGVCRYCGVQMQAKLGHVKGTAATCVKPQRCTRCQAVLVAATGKHELKEPPTCEKNGVCKNCGVKMKDALNHTFQPEGIYNANGCVYSCARCQKQTTKDHNYLTQVAGKPATCTSTGTTATKQCTVCNYMIPPTTIPKKDHSYTVATGDGSAKGCIYKCATCSATTTKAHANLLTIPAKEATCTEEGHSESKKCKACGFITKQPLKRPKKAHSYTVATGHYNANGCIYKCATCAATTIKSHSKLTTIPGKAATCTQTGYTESKKCVACGLVTTQAKTINALGHSKGPSATCTTAQTCTRCSQTITKALGHTKGPEATCISDQTCTRCRIVLKAKTGHSYGPTPTAYNQNVNGHTPIYKCKNCSSTKYDSQEAHTINSYSDNGNGTHSGTCTTCDYRVTKAHDTNSGTCTACGATVGSGTTTCEHAWVTKNNSTDHWQECSKCGVTQDGSVTNHNIARYIDNGDQTHSGTCTVCNYKVTNGHTYSDNTCTKCGATNITECEHAWITKNNLNEHWQECSKCYIVKEGSLANHTVTTWNDKGNGAHEGTCTGCGETITKAHDYNGGNNCVNCGAAKQAECEHNWVTKSDNEQHWKQCDKCQIIQDGTIENHNITSWTDNGDGTHSGTCTTCNLSKKDTHDFNNGTCTECGANENDVCEHEWETKSNPEEHWQECKKCYVTKENSEEKHTIASWEDKNNGTHSGICTVCNYTVIKEHNYSDGNNCTDCGAARQSACEHNWVTKKDIERHWQECSKCNILKDGSLEKHKVTSWTNNGDGTHSGTCTSCAYMVVAQHDFNSGVCDECQAKEGETGCVHEWITMKDDNKHWQECTKCDVIKDGSGENHTFGNWEDKKNGAHTGTCTVCKYQTIELHNFRDGVCTKCQAKEEESPQCTHEWIINSVQTKHWQECKKCGVTKENSSEAHTVKSWTDNGDGTHSGVCTVCNYKVTDYHSNGTESNCDKCNYIVKDDDGNQGENNGANNSDKTNSRKELPNTGKKTVIISVIGLTTLFGTSIVGIKKYKDIV